MRKYPTNIFTIGLSFFAFSFNANAIANECQSLFRSTPIESVSRELLDKKEIDSGYNGSAGVVSDDGVYYVANRVSGRFAALALSGKLIGQIDQNLRDRKLLVPNGGLCATTCGVNILHTLFAYVGVSTWEFEFRSDFQLERMLDAVKSEFNKDGRLGINITTHLSFALKSVVGMITGDFRNLGTKSWSFDADGFFSALHRREEHMLQVAAVTASNDSSHAIVIIGMNEEKKRISYADPNNPNQILTTDYEETTYKGSPTIRIRWIGKYPEPFGYVKRVMNIWSQGISHYIPT